VKEMMELSKRDVRQRFDYVPIDKSRPLIYRQDTSRTKRGDPVGSFCRRNDNYVGGVGGKNYLIHRLVWLWKDPATSVYSAVPKVLDHINQDHHDNRYENLRAGKQSLTGNDHQQLEFGFCDESPAQQVLDLNDVVLVR
jgi:hypothetical protein